MDELTCFTCQAHVGWMSYSGPHGLVMCDSCKIIEDEENGQGENKE